jgi:hypothetical protein
MVAGSVCPGRTVVRSATMNGSPSKGLIVIASVVLVGTNFASRAIIESLPLTSPNPVKELSPITVPTTRSGSMTPCETR